MFCWFCFNPEAQISITRILPSKPGQVDSLWLSLIFSLLQIFIVLNFWGIMHQLIYHIQQLIKATPSRWVCDINSSAVVCLLTVWWMLYCRDPIFLSIPSLGSLVRICRGLLTKAAPADVEFQALPHPTLSPLFWPDSRLPLTSDCSKTPARRQ